MLPLIGGREGRRGVGSVMAALRGYNEGWKWKWLGGEVELFSCRTKLVKCLQFNESDCDIFSLAA